MKQLIASRDYKQALDVFDRQSTLTTDATLVLALKASTKLADEQRGVRIHQQLSSSSLHNPYIQTSLIHFYMQCHRVNEAERIFSTMKKKTVFSYGAMMKGYLSNNRFEKVIAVFETMSIEPNELIIAMLFNACAKLRDARAVKMGNDVLRRLPQSLLQQEEVMRSVTNMLMRFNAVAEAERLFERTKNKSIDFYMDMMQNYVNNDLFAEALSFVAKVPFHLNELLHVFTFKACAALCDEKATALGNKLLANMPLAFLQDIRVVSTTIHMLTKFGEVGRAEQIFEQTKNKDVVSYGALMQGYLVNKQFTKALDLYEKIPLELAEVGYAIVYKACAEMCDARAMDVGKRAFEQMPKPFLNDVVVSTAIVHMFMRFTEVETAEHVAKQIKTPTQRTYGALINGYRINEQPHKCLLLFDEMKKKGMRVNEPIAQSLVGACAQIGMRSISEAIAGQIGHMKHDLHLQSALIDMWGKSGDIDRAREIFESITQRDVFSYTNMINAYGLNGRGFEAINIYEQMPGSIRNVVSHICVLNACSHAGLVDQARSIFDNIEQKTERIVATMVDCFSRLSLFDEGQQLIDDFEKSHPPYPVMYMALLSGARNHRQASLSQQLYERMQRLFPDRQDDLIAASVLVCNTCSSSGDELRAREVRLDRLKRFGKNPKIGVTWTEVKGKLVQFQAHDRSHPQSAEIYAQVARISVLLKQYGHEYDSAWVTRPLDESEDIESALCGHSEKLAIAYNLIQNPQPSFIQMTKNLRVCGDCHRATKLIAKIFECEIIVRDANRIHHFSPNGQCSCQDHF